MVTSDRVILLPLRALELEAQRMAEKSYTDYVVAQSRQNLCLTNLCYFLAENLPRTSPRIVSLMLSEPEKSPIRQDLDFGGLQCLLTKPCPDKRSKL